MNVPDLLTLNIAITLAAMFVLWLVSLPLRNASIVDIFWGPGFGLIALVTFFVADGLLERRLLLTVLTCAWSLRLGVYLALRNIGHGEDPRYVAMRNRREAAGGSFALFSLASVFGLQGVLMWLISWPVQLGQLGDAPLGLAAATGVILWAIGFLFEAVGDLQLRRFKANPNNLGKVMDRGLWRYTRHPNYFGNACLWWGLWLIASETAPLWTLISPILMTLLLLKVSGVSLLEKSLKASKPGYADYVRRTSSFFPWFPRSD